MAEHEYDLVIVGAGSGNMLPSEEFADWRIAVVETSRFGGTCLNRGCIPSKMLVYTADVARVVHHAGLYGIKAKWGGADWPAIRERVFGRIDPLHDKAVAAAVQTCSPARRASSGPRSCASAMTRSRPSDSCSPRDRARPSPRSPAWPTCPT